MSTPRGISNCNPGNIRRGPDQWQGLSDQQTDPAFWQFQTPYYGLRALALNLLAYYRRLHLNTVSLVINRWAPASENNTTAYVRAVAREMGVGESDELNLLHTDEMAPLVAAIVRHENGQQPYSDALIRSACEAAGCA